MAGSSTLGQFLMSEDVHQAAMLAACTLQNLTDRDKDMIRKILDHNWDDEEQMVSNLLQFPYLLPEDIRLSCLQRGLEGSEIPYYIISASVGIQRLQFDENELQSLTKILRKAIVNEHAAVCMRAFITLQPYLHYPTDISVFVDILKSKKSPLHDGALSWLVLHVNDKKELINILKDGVVPSQLISNAEKKMDMHCESLAHGEESPISIEVFDYIPNLVDFEAMLDKEDTLSEFFEDLDTDRDSKLSADEVQTFLEDIGKDVSIDEIVNEMKSIGIDDSGKIDRDGFIEMMFPKFQVH